MNKGICLEFKKVAFSYPDEPGKKILSSISFKVNEGKIIAILGENGAGKTTILNLICGFIKPTSGKIIYHNTAQLSIFSTLIPQEYSLLDWKTVYENIGLSLSSIDIDDVEYDKTINNLIDILKIKEYKRKLPQKLSGGIKQRVAIARALAPNPKLLLFDEPFNSLDLSIKQNLFTDIKNIIQKSNKCGIIVTHNIDEAIYFADRILVLDKKTRSIKGVLNNYPNSNKNEIKLSLTRLLQQY